MLRGEIDIAVHSSKDLPTALPDGIVHRRLSAARGPARRADLGQGDDHRRSAAGRHARHRVAAAAGAGQAVAAGPSGRPVARQRRDAARQGRARRDRRDAAGLRRPEAAGARASRDRAAGDRGISARPSGRARSASPRAPTMRATLAALAAILDAATGEALACERAFLAVLDGSCKTPIAGHARREGGALRFRGAVYRADGSEAFEIDARGRAGGCGARSARRPAASCWRAACACWRIRRAAARLLKDLHRALQRHARRPRRSAARPRASASAEPTPKPAARLRRLRDAFRRPRRDRRPAGASFISHLASTGRTSALQKKPTTRKPARM